MRRSSLLVLIFILTVLVRNYTFGQLVITPQSNAQALTQRLVGNGVVISNVVLTAAPIATGFFNNYDGTKIGIDSGILLTNGRAKSINNSWGVDGNQIIMAQNAFANTNLNLPGDADIARLLSIPVGQTHDATILEFDFIPLGDSIKFNYVFSSEEYTPAYVCDFNDAFAFFISGPGITGLKNIALVPNTNTPVSIFNVNNVPGGACPNNAAYYIDNTTNSFFTHDGHTKVLTAKEGVQSCQKYHLKLVIADVGDGLFDSGVFLQAKSLSSNAVSLHINTQVDPQNNNYLVEGCTPGSFKISRPQADASNLSVSLLYGGTAINGVDVQLLPSVVTIPANQTEVVVNVVPVVDNIPEGIETLKIYALAGCNANTPSDSTIIQIRDYDTLGINPDTVIICKNSSIQLNASAGYSVYQWDANPALSNLNINNPVALPASAVNTFYCTAIEGNCHARDSSLVIWKYLSFLSKTEINCKGYSNGEIKVAGGEGWTRPLEFALNNGPFQNDSTFSNLVAGLYVVKAKDAAGCIDSLTINIAQLFPDLVINGTTITSATCTGNADGSVTIIAAGGSSPYLFSSDGINFQPGNVLHLVQGNYPVTVKDNNNCTTATSVFVPLDNVVTVNAGPDTTICEGKSTQIKAISNADSFTWAPAITLNNAAVLQPIAAPVTTTEYFITAQKGICLQKDSVTIFVNPAPKANAGADQTICFGQNVQLSGSGGQLYFWHPASYLDNTRIASPTAQKLPGSIIYTLSVTDAKGCTSIKNDTIHITVTRPAIVNAGPDTALAIGQPLPLFAKDVNNIGFIQYEWSPNYGLNNSFTANPVTVLDKDITYTVTARNAIGCQGSDDIKISVFRGPDIYVPNAFSPNADGLNDILRAKPVGIKNFHYFRIYNRWGNLVFMTTDPLTGWDGKMNGADQVTGSTYIWVAEGTDYKGTLVQKKGTVLLIK